MSPNPKYSLRSATCHTKLRTGQYFPADRPGTSHTMTSVADALDAANAASATTTAEAARIDAMEQSLTNQTAQLTTNTQQLAALVAAGIGAGGGGLGGGAGGGGLGGGGGGGTGGGVGGFVPLAAPLNPK